MPLTRCVLDIELNLDCSALVTNYHTYHYTKQSLLTLDWFAITYYWDTLSYFYCIHLRNFPGITAWAHPLREIGTEIVQFGTASTRVGRGAGAGIVRKQTWRCFQSVTIYSCCASFFVVYST